MTRGKQEINALGHLRFSRIVLHRRIRFFGLRPQNDRRRKCMSQFVVLSVSEESLLFRADPRSRHPPPRGRETPAAIRFLCIAHLLQICGFAGLFILLSILSGTPLSSLVGRKLQRSTRRRGERNLPALRSTPLRAESFLFRSSAAAHNTDLPALLLKCFHLETQILSPMKRGETCSE